MLAGRAEDGHRADPARVGRCFRKRGIVIIFSYLLDDVDAILAGLEHFRHRRHEVVLMHGALDPAEIDFPFDQMMLFHGLEGLPELLAEPRALRNVDLAELQKFLHRLKKGGLATADRRRGPSCEPISRWRSSGLRVTSHRGNNIGVINGFSLNYRRLACESIVFRE